MPFYPWQVLKLTSLGSSNFSPILVSGNFTILGSSKFIPVILYFGFRKTNHTEFKFYRCHVLFWFQEN